MRHHLRLLRSICVVSAVLFALHLWASAAPAQGMGSGRPSDPFGDDEHRLAEPPEFSQGPKIPAGPTVPKALPDFPGSAPNEIQIWKCSSCDAVLGTGPNEPKLEQCPKCGTKLTSRFNYYIVGGVGGAILAGLLIISLFSRAKRPDSASA